MKSIVVFYHKNCLDGFTSAWAAWKKFGAEAEYIGLDPRRPTVPHLKNKTIYFLDIICSEPDLKKLVNKNQSVIVIDHHVSRKDMIQFASDELFSLDHSGAVLSWRYFHPNKSIPKLLLHIEDYDLWRFKLPGTKEINAELGTHPFDFKEWGRVIADFENPAKRKKIITTGKVLVAADHKIARQIVENAKKVLFAGHSALVANSPVLNSEIGHEILRRGFPIGIIWSEENGDINVSLRSKKGVDVSKIAKKFDGGGHKNAAGFRLKATQTFPWK